MSISSNSQFIDPFQEINLGKLSQTAKAEVTMKDFIEYSNSNALSKIFIRLRLGLIENKGSIKDIRTANFNKLIHNLPSMQIKIINSSATEILLEKNGKKFSIQMKYEAKIAQSIIKKEKQERERKIEIEAKAIEYYQKLDALQENDASQYQQIFNNFIDEFAKKNLHEKGVDLSNNPFLDKWKNEVQLSDKHFHANMKNLAKDFFVRKDGKFIISFKNKKENEINSFFNFIKNVFCDYLALKEIEGKDVVDEGKINIKEGLIVDKSKITQNQQNIDEYKDKEVAEKLKTIKKLKLQEISSKYGVQFANFMAELEHARQEKIEDLKKYSQFRNFTNEDIKKFVEMNFFPPSSGDLSDSDNTMNSKEGRPSDFSDFSDYSCLILKQMFAEYLVRGKNSKKR